jgi:hypothetical protein
MKVIRYWARVLWRAAKDTVASQKIGAKIVGLLAFAIGIGIASQLVEQRSIENRITWWVVSVATASIMAFLNFIWNVLATPPLFEDEVGKKVDALTKTIGEMKDASNKQADQHAAALAESVTAISKMTQELEKARNSDPRRNAIRHQILHYLSKLEEMLNAIVEDGLCNARPIF